MNPRICKSLISLSFNKSPCLQKPATPYSISLLFFSSSSGSRKSKTKISLADYLINQHHFSPEAALKASSTKNYLKNPENSDSILSFLKQNGFSNTQLEKMVKRTPQFLSANLDNTIKPKIDLFRDLGFSSTDIADIISSDPWILTRSAVNQIVPSILVLKSVIGSNAGVSRVLKISSWFLKCDLDKTLMPNIEFMKKCGICSSQMVQYMFNFPRFFVNKPESIKDFVKRVDEIGFDRKSKMFLHAIRAISSMTRENWELKLKLFRRIGFSEDDILSLFRRSPQVFAISERKILKGTEMLLNSANFDISYIVKNPSLLLCSVEHRLKPRLEVFDILQSKNLLPRKTSLTTIFKMSEKMFLDKYVVPYASELGELSSRAH